MKISKTLLGAILVVAVALVVYVASVSTTHKILRATPPPSRGHSLPTSTSTSSSASTTIPPADKACVHVLTLLLTLNWHDPTLTAASLSPWATPSLANSLLSIPHMTPGEIAGHWDVVPTVTVVSVLARGEVVVDTVQPLPAGSDEEIWDCSMVVGKVASVGLQQ